MTRAGERVGCGDTRFLNRGLMSIHLLNSDNVDDFLEQVSMPPDLVSIPNSMPSDDLRHFIVDTNLCTRRRHLADRSDAYLPHPEVASHLIEPEWIVHGSKFDLKLLNGFLGGLPKTVWDTQLGGGLLELKYPASYGHLVQKYLNISLGKHATLSNWARRPLSKEQIKYAAEDVLHFLPLWDSITRTTSKRTFQVRPTLL